MFDPKRAARIDLKQKRLRDDARSVKRNLRTWEDEVDETEEEYEDYEIER